MREQILTALKYGHFANVKELAEYLQVPVTPSLITELSHLRVSRMVSWAGKPGSAIRITSKGYDEIAQAV